MGEAVTLAAIVVAAVLLLWGIVALVIVPRRPLLRLAVWVLVIAGLVWFVLIPSQL
jgi:hypothetical protein